MLPNRLSLLQATNTRQPHILTMRPQRWNLRNWNFLNPAHFPMTSK
jgi:hypothetical protein